MTIGRPIAISEPNVSSSTTIAASSPTAVEMPKPACSVCLDRLAAELDLQARRARRRGRRRRRVRAALFGRSLAFSSNTTVANAIRPLAEIDLPDGGAA